MTMNRFMLIALQVTAASALLAEVKLPSVISSHMVLQRDAAVPVWGTASPQEKVTVTFRGQKKEATADDKGNWLVKLDPLQAGGPDVMTINTISLEDVLVGEVWVGSGQSNMAGGAGGYARNDPGLAAILAAAPYNQLRVCRVAQSWKAGDSNNLASFSALLLSFGAQVQKELNVPVGLMVGAVGGTPSGYWLSKEAFSNDAGCKAVVAEAVAAFTPEKAEKLKKANEQQLAKWEAAVAAAKAKGETKLPQKPKPLLKPGECSGQIGHLYEAHIRPFQPYGIRGVLWDQGESGTAIQDVDQYTLMGALISGWRREWALPGAAPLEFPFIYIQKPSGGGCAWDLGNPTTSKAQAFEPLPEKVPEDGEYIEKHVRIMNYPQTAMAISSDLGPGVHPTNKSGYGKRAADVALGMVYGKKLAYYGPLYKSHRVEGGKVRVTFSHVGQGLAFKHGEKLQGFALAGEDGQFHWAEATIDGDTVLLSCAQVSKPVHVRYAWAMKRTWANLFNKDGLPAIPFRTDKK